MGFYSHELRNLLGTASLAFAAAKAGNLSLHGATGSILARSLTSLEKMIAGSLADIKMNNGDEAVLGIFPLAEFINEICAAAGLAAKFHNSILRAPDVESSLALLGNRDLLMAAVTNLLQNAFKFTTPNSEVWLTAYASGDQILIDVRDHCGGLGAGVEETMFLPFSQGGTDRSGLGLGLTISQQSVRANGGTLTVRNLPGSGCVFTISMPRHEMPT